MKKTGALAIVEPGLTGGQEAGRSLGRRICCKVRKFEFCILVFKMYIRHFEQIFSIDKVVPVDLFPVFWQILLQRYNIYPAAFLWKP